MIRNFPTIIFVVYNFLRNSLTQFLLSTRILVGSWHLGTGIKTQIISFLPLNKQQQQLVIKMALNLISMVTKYFENNNNSAKFELPEVNLVKRSRSNFEEALSAVPPAKMPKFEEEQKIENCAPYCEEEEEITYETEAENIKRIKDQEIAQLKEKNRKLKKSNEDKDAIIKMLTEQLAAANKKSDSKFNIEIPLNFGVLNCGN